MEVSPVLLAAYGATQLLSGVLDYLKISSAVTDEQLEAAWQEVIKNANDAVGLWDTPTNTKE